MRVSYKQRVGYKKKVSYKQRIIQKSGVSYKRMINVFICCYVKEPDKGQSTFYPNKYNRSSIFLCSLLFIRHSYTYSRVLIGSYLPPLPLTLIFCVCTRLLVNLVPHLLLSWRHGQIFFLPHSSETPG